MPYDPGQRRRALKEFLTENGISQRALCAASKMSPSAIAQFISGRSRSLTDESYCALADGASKMLGRLVTPDVLRGEGSSAPSTRMTAAQGDRIIEFLERIECALIRVAANSGGR